MAGTVDGGRKARDTNYRLHGKGFYKRIGSMGGKNGHTGGFFADRELARVAGALGGRKSRRGKAIRTTNLSDAEKVAPYERLESDPLVHTK